MSITGGGDAMQKKKKKIHGHSQKLLQFLEPPCVDLIGSHFQTRQLSNFFVPTALYLLPEAPLGVSCDTHRLPWPSPLVLMSEGHGDSSGWVITQLSFACLEAVSHFPIAAKSETGVAGSEAC